METAMEYCSKCGCIMPHDVTKCNRCDSSTVYPIPLKWGITEEWDRDRDRRYLRKEMTHRQYYREFVNRVKPFIDTVVKNSPEFDSEEYKAFVKFRLEDEEAEIQSNFLAK